MNSVWNCTRIKLAKQSAMARICEHTKGFCGLYKWPGTCWQAIRQGVELYTELSWVSAESADPGGRAA
jgi:hypothetical protein